MNFQSDKSQLQAEFDILKHQSLQTSEAWNDSVKDRFYEQFINILPQGFQSYINELDKLDKSFETGEKIIAEL